MKVGVVFPQTEIGSDPVVVRDYAQAAESLGYSHILIHDHVVGAVHEDRDPPLWGAYTEQDAFHEPLTLIAHLAAITETITFVPGVLILPQRQTVLVAKQAAEIAILSDNRLRLGVGVGWNHVEFEALNENFHDRGKREEEQVSLLRELWNDDIIDFSGTWHRVDRAGLKPRPSASIPIWFGGFTPVAFKRAARIGDGFLLTRLLQPSADGTPRSEPAQGLVERADFMRSLVAEAGRPPESFEVEGRVNFIDGPESWNADLELFRNEGFEYTAVQPLGSGVGTPDAHLKALATFAAEVGLGS